MLDELNRQVVDRLEVDVSSHHRVLDMGCGLGTTARHAARRYPKVEVTGITIVPSVLHIPRIACKFLMQELLASRTRMTRVRRNHVIAPALLPIIGFARRRFGYFLVTARKG